MFGVAIVAGFAGAMLGLGGGVIIVPALTLLFGRGMHEAIGVSAVTVIATSVSAAAVYIREGMVNIRLALFLEVATVAGAILGSCLGLLAKPVLLEALFALLVLYTAYCMARSGHADVPTLECAQEDGHDHPDDTQYLDRATGAVHSYRPTALIAGSGASLGAGLMSGLLGVGGGFVKVPVMNLVMGVPLKAAIATSNYRMGISSAATAVIYSAHGYVKPMVVAPCAVGVLLGAHLGSKLSSRTHSSVLRWVFVALLTAISLQMLKKALGASP